MNFFCTGIDIDPYRVTESFNLIHAPLFQNLPIPSLIVSLDGFILDVNQPAESVLGNTKNALINLPVAKLIHPQDRYLLRKLAGNLVKNERDVVSTKARVLREDVDLLLCEVKASFVKDENNFPLAAILQFLDISLSQSMLDALRENEKKYRLLVEMSNDLIWSVDVNGCWTFVNRRATKSIYGYEPEEMIGRSFVEFVDPEYLKRDLETFNKIKQGETFFSYETRHITKAGKRVDLSFNATVITDENGQVLGTTGTAVNITEHRKVCAKLEKDIIQRSFVEQILREIAEAVSSGYGQSLFESLVIKISNVLGVKHAFISEVIADNKDIARTRAMAVDGEIVANIEYALRGTPCAEVLLGNEKCYTSGVSKYFPEDHLLKEMGGESYCGVPLFSRNRQILGMLGVLDSKPLDQPEHITSMLKIFAIRVAAELERILADKERAEFESRLQHVQKLESLGVLAGGIAHDFNNLLVGILGNASLALNELSENNPIYGRIRHVKSAAKRASELTNNLLAYTGRASCNVTRVNLSQIVLDMVSLLRASVSKQAVISCGCINEAVYIDADQTQIQQVVMNLIINASDALGEQEGVISISTGEVNFENNSPSLVYVSDRLYGRCGYIEVKDTGCGMESETIKKIFDPFFTTKFTGRGLGLATVLGIIRSHRGAIEVESKLGEGTKFRVLFPLIHFEQVPPEVSAIAVTDDTRELQGEGRQILVVDDEEVVQQVFVAMLEKVGFKVLTADRGDQAIKIFRRHKNNIYCVILDLTMPGMNGLEVKDEIRKISANLPVIISSGYSEQEIGDLSDKYCLFIQKPFAANELYSALANFLKY